MGIIIQDFHDLHEWSESEPVIDLIHNTLKYFFGEDKMINNTDITTQKKGIDKIYKGFTIEHKIRKTYYPDFLFETLSNSSTGTIGWADKNLDCQIYIYGWLPTRTTYTFEYMDLISVWKRYRTDWISNYKSYKSYNKVYYSESVVVPISEVLKYTDSGWLYKEGFIK